MCSRLVQFRFMESSLKRKIQAALSTSVSIDAHSFVRKGSRTQRTQSLRAELFTSLFLWLPCDETFPSRNESDQALRSAERAQARRIANYGASCARTRSHDTLSRAARRAHVLASRSRFSGMHQRVSVQTLPTQVSARGEHVAMTAPIKSLCFAQRSRLATAVRLPAVRASSVPLSTCIHPSRCPTASALRVATEELPLYHRSVVRLAVNRCPLAHSRANVGCD